MSLYLIEHNKFLMSIVYPSTFETTVVGINKRWTRNTFYDVRCAVSAELNVVKYTDL